MAEGSTAFLKEIDDLLLETDNNGDVDDLLAGLDHTNHNGDLDNGLEEDSIPSEPHTPVNGDIPHHPTK